MKLALLLLVSALFTAVGVWMVCDGQKSGYFCGGFFALGLPVFAIQFHPRAAYLRLTTDGFTFCSLFRACTIRWEYVQEFGVAYVGLKRMVAWNFAPGCPIHQRGRNVAKALSGFEAALPDTYGMKARDLADLLNGLRQQYTGARKTGG